MTNFLKASQAADEKAVTIAYGFCAMIDGFVRIASLGFVKPSYTLSFAKWAAKRRAKLYVNK